MDSRPSRWRVRLRRPSPAMVVAVTALVVACSGTAVAAGVLITSSNQLADSVVTADKLRTGAVTSDKLANRSVTGAKVVRGSLGGDLLTNGQVSLNKLTPAAVQALQGGGGTAFEFIRKTGPEGMPAGSASRVITADNVPAGVYAIYAKTILSDLDPPANLLIPGRTADGHCELGAGGDLAEGRAMIGTAYGTGPGDVYAQITHTFAGPGTITLSCDAESTWRASDTSIIAVRLSTASRSELPG